MININGYKKERVGNSPRTNGGDISYIIYVIFHKTKRTLLEPYSVGSEIDSLHKKLK
jgi:hypothetical protein